jgi:hypothetical protein
LVVPDRRPKFPKVRPELMIALVPRFEMFPTPDVAMNKLPPDPVNELLNLKADALELNRLMLTKEVKIVVPFEEAIFPLAACAGLPPVRQTAAPTLAAKRAEHFRFAILFFLLMSLILLF